MTSRISSYLHALFRYLSQYTLKRDFNIVVSLCYIYDWPCQYVNSLSGAIHRIKFQICAIDLNLFGLKLDAVIWLAYL